MSSPGESYRRPLFALLIGINKYKCYKWLHGCINDAKEVQFFLQRTLGAPQENIATLFDEQATRLNILDTFEGHLVQNPNIQQGDPIVIFFAGHGGRVRAPEGWITADGQIETICPYDEWEKDKDGNDIPGIPDGTINRLLHRLHVMKGNNIVVILDCCHSGSGTRGDLVPRAVQNPCPITNPQQDMDRLQLNLRHGSPFRAEKFTSSMASHVLFAACKQEEQAMESSSEPAHGLFTYALVCALRNLAPNLSRITYAALMKSLPPINRQTPQLEGIPENKTRIVFSSMVRDVDRIPNFDVTVAATNPNPGREITLNVSAGLIHGVKRGTGFTIWDYSPNLGQPKFLGEGVAETVDAFTSQCTIKHQAGFGPDISRTAKALISNWNNEESILRVFVEGPVSQKVVLARALCRVTAFRRTKWHFLFVAMRKEPHLILAYDSGRGELAIKRLGWMTAYGTETISVRLPADKIAAILPLLLNHIAGFRYHLERCGRNITDVASKVNMRLYKLTEPPRRPDTKYGDLFEKGLPGDLPDNIREAIQSERSPHDRRAFVPNNPEVGYGIEITNTSNSDLFPYLFFFDLSDYSIGETYLPPSNTMDAPLKAPGFLNIGYGNGGMPLAYGSDMGDGYGLDSAFYKLFVSDENIDMNQIRQGSIHELDGSSRLKQLRLKDEVKIWGTSMASVSVY